MLRFCDLLSLILLYIHLLKFLWNIFQKRYFKNLYIYIYIYYWAISQMSRVFANGPGDRGSIPGWVIPKTQKWYLMPPCLVLSTKRRESSWAILWMEQRHSQHLEVVAIEKGAFGSSSTKFTNFTFIYIYTNFVEHNRHFLSTYFLFDLFILQYCFYRIRQLWAIIKEGSITNVM